MAHLTNEAWLVLHRFYADERVIVPRSFIAELLHEELAPGGDDPERVTRVLDLRTGSGCLAILAALAFPNANVDAVDLSTGALASGEDGLDHTRTILREAHKHLTGDGLLIVEVGFNREGVERAFPALPVTWLEVSAGDGVVFLVEAQDLHEKRTRTVRLTRCFRRFRPNRRANSGVWRSLLRLPSRTDGECRWPAPSDPRHCCWLQ